MIGFDLLFDRYGIFLSCLFLFLGFLSFIYSLATIKQKGHRLEYYLMLLLIVGSGIGVAVFSNLLVIYIFWELSTLAIWRTTAFYRKPENIAAANFTFLVNFAAAAVMLVGIAILYVDNMTLNLMQMKIFNDWAMVLILVGILAKSVTIPLHIWLVPAYNSVPSAIGSLLAGIAENLGLVLFLRLFTTGTYNSPAFFNAVAWLAIVSSLVAGGGALLANNLRNLLAFSTISQVGFILLGLAVGGPYGLVGALLYIFAHALAKSGLFMGVGVIEDATGTSDLKAVSGMLTESPVLAMSMAFLAGSIVGFFPMIGFFAKLEVILGAVEKLPYLGVGAIVAAIFTLLYNVRFYHEIFFGKKMTNIKRFSNTGTGVVFVLALVSLLAGILFYRLMNYLMTGGF